MPEIRPIAAGEVDPLRELRLRALRDAPTAFASTADEEAAFDDERWAELAAAAASADEHVVLVAVDGPEWVGMAGGRWLDREAGIAHLWGMWVAPERRRRGVGGRLVAGVRAWAAGHGARFLRLGVIEDAGDATRFYEDLGFVASGETRPLVRDRSRRAVFYVRPI